MKLFDIDGGKCTRCGACQDECPIRIITMRGDELPSLHPALADFCINCGHCVAVCPHGALTHRNLRPEDCMDIRKEWRQTEEQTEHFLRYRRSIRTYRDRPVEREKLAKLIDIARYAPSGHNMQPVSWTVLLEREKVRTLTGLTVDWMRHLTKEMPAMAKEMHLDLIIAAWDMGVDIVCRDAPHVIIAHGPESNPATQGSCVIALAYLELAAAHMGIGACWAGYFGAASQYWPPMKKALELPDGHGAFGAMLTGHAKYPYHRMPERNPAAVHWK